MGNEIIAIVGPYGSGKTVLLTVLTHFYHKESKEGYQILPDNLEAISFCQENWDSLRRGEWPSPTPPTDNPAIYSWKLRFGEKEKTLITADVAGEAWRDFIKENIKGLPNSAWQNIVNKMETIPSVLSQVSREKHVMTLDNLLNKASRVYILMDLSQIVDQEPGYKDAMLLPYCLQLYMKRKHKARTPVTLVLSKTDRYYYLLEQKHDWRAVMEEYFEFIPQYTDIIPIAAVAKTRTIKGRMVPVQNFPSEGLDVLYKSFWNPLPDSFFVRFVRHFFSHSK